MPLFTIHNVAIAGMAAAVPDTVVKTEDAPQLSSHYDAADFAKSTGIEERRYSDVLTTTDLGLNACDALINKLGWERDSIDALVLVTQSPDFSAPASACIMQHRLGLTRECAAYDISLGCSGWVYGLSQIAAILAAGNMNRALLVVGDSRPRHNFGVDPLCGSAAAVTAIEHREGNKMDFHLGTDGSGWDALYIPDGGARHPFTEKSLKKHEFNGTMITPLESHMLGMDVFSFGITAAPKSVKAIRKFANIGDDDIDYYVFHQANKLMIDTINKKLKLTIDRTPRCLAKYGNTSSASVPLTIIANFAGNRERDLKLICCGFGIGLSWGSVALTLSKNAIILPVIDVADSFVS